MRKTWELRAEFARRLSVMYGREVPAYLTLLEVSQEVNAAVVAERGDAAQRLGGIGRVSAERHGAIRLGSAGELAQVARLFAAVGMHPVGFYDLRSSGVPVVSTAFRPIDADELELNPFRVFTSVLTSEDPRFFSADLGARVRAFIDARDLFPPQLLELADRCADHGGLEDGDAAVFLGLLTAAFELDMRPIDRAWHDELHAISPVAADIAGTASTHINHLTPRVLDIDALHAEMTGRGVEMIPDIQGPPRWDGPDVLLRQTSFRALAESRQFLEHDGSVTTGALRVRFGEVEARGVALTQAGREVYDQALAAVDGLAADRDRAVALRQVWVTTFPTTELELCTSGLAAFTLTPNEHRPRDGRVPSPSVDTLVADGFATLQPIVYEDFLPRSAAGIFHSNLDGGTTSHVAEADHGYDETWFANALGRTVRNPEQLYADITHSSLEAAARAFNLPGADLAASISPKGTPSCV